MRPSLLQLDTSVQVRVRNKVQLWPKGRKTASFWGRFYWNVNYGAVHLMGDGQNHYSIFCYCPETHLLWWGSSFLFSLKWTNVSQEQKKKNPKKQQWSLNYWGRHKTVAGVWVLTRTPITLISPPFPHPLQLNTKTRHGPRNWRKLVPWRLPWPRYWAERQKTHTTTPSQALNKPPALFCAPRAVAWFVLGLFALLEN